MTIVIAQKTTTGVLMGADETSTDGSRLLRRGTPKLANITPRLVVGVSGSVRIGDLALTSSSWPSPDSQTPVEFRIALAEFFRVLLKDEPKDASFWAIVAADRDIYYVGVGGCVLLVNDSYCALGNAELVALGAMYVFNRVNNGSLPRASLAKEVMTTVMDACAEHVKCIRPPWSFAETTAP